jgi:hypothetical protein
MTPDPKTADAVLQAALETIGRAIAVIDRSVEGEDVNPNQVSAAQHVIDHFTPLVAELRQIDARKNRGFT